MRNNRIAFIDTNILAYAFDESDEERRDSCSNIVRAGFTGEAQCCLSNQVLSELYVVLTRKVGKPLPKEKAFLIVSGFADSPKWKKLNYTHFTVKKTLLELQQIKTSFWDMLIAETMREEGIKVLYTENQKDFRDIPWVETKSPL